MLALSRPTEAVSRTHDLRVALLRSDGSFDYDWEDSAVGWRVRVETVSAGHRHDFPRARLTVNLAGICGEGDEVLIPPLRLGDLHGLISHETRLVIYAQPPAELIGGDSPRQFLFDGYAKVENIKMSGAPGREFLTLNLLCTSLLEKLAAESTSWISGCYFEDEDNGIRKIEGPPCIFNYRGRPNRAPDLVTRTFIGVDLSVPVFTYNGDPDAVYWTYADVLTYLLSFCLWPAGESYPLADGNGVDICAAIVAANEGPKEFVDVDNPTTKQALESKANELVMQGMNIVDAMLYWCEAAGFTVQQWTFADSASDPDTQFLFSLLGDGGPFQDYGEEGDRTVRTLATHVAPDPRALQLESSGLETGDREPAEILVGNEIEQGEIIYDAKNKIGSARVVGDVKRFEVTIGEGFGTHPADILKPGWLPDSTFGDDLSGGTMDDKIEDLDETTEDELTDAAETLYHRYVRGGENHAAYLAVGRLWMANEAGELTGGDYGRANGGGSAWAAAVYADPYDFHSYCGVPKLEADGEWAEKKSWIARRRAVLRLISVGADSNVRPPLVRCSWDSGSHWYTYPGNCRFLGQRSPLDAQCGLVLTDSNLASVKNKQPVDGDSTEDQSVWEAIVRGTFRLSVTCAVEGDARVVGESDPAAVVDAVIAHEEIQAGRDFRHENVSEGNSILDGETGWSYDDVNEGERAKAAANRLVALNRSQRVAGNFILPWLTAKWLPNDLCIGIQTAGIDFGDATRYPWVTRVLWINSEAGQTTHVTIGDARGTARNA